MKRLYCAGEGAERRYCLSTSQPAAEQALGGADVRLPDESDLRHFWEANRLSERSSRDVAQSLGVSHQTVCNWRMKACRVDKVLAYREAAHQELVQRVQSELKPGAVVADVGRKLGLSRSTVERIAQELGFETRKGNTKKPPDEEIIRLAEGRSWRELAEACNVSMGTLRNYVYARPELSTAVKAKMRRLPTGSHAQGKVNPKIIAELHRMGVGVVGIATSLGIEPMTVMHWLDKLGLRDVPYIRKGAKGNGGTDKA